jgi:hypothetical protein
MEKNTHFQSLSSAPPVKMLSLQVPLAEPPYRETIHFQSPLLLSLSKSPVNKPPLQLPHWGPYRKRCLSPELSFIYPSESPMKEPSLLALLIELQ